MCCPTFAFPAALLAREGADGNSDAAPQRNQRAFEAPADRHCRCLEEGYGAAIDNPGATAAKEPTMSGSMKPKFDSERCTSPARGSIRSAGWTGRAVLVSSMLALSACAGMSNQEKGTAIGAGVGAVGGQILGNSPAATVGGAVVGGVVGNQVGRKKDEREERDRRRDWAP